MNHLIDNGMAFYWGTSEWNAQQLTEAALVARELGLVGPICDQLQCELGLRVAVPFCGSIGPEAVEEHCCPHLRPAWHASLTSRA